MPHSWLGLAFTGLLCILLLPIFAITMLIAAICSAPFAVFLPFRKRRRARGFECQTLQAADEFGFEHAIEVYEELIDAHAWRPM